MDIEGHLSGECRGLLILTGANCSRFGVEGSTPPVPTAGGPKITVWRSAT